MLDVYDDAPPSGTASVGHLRFGIHVEMHVEALSVRSARTGAMRSGRRSAMRKTLTLPLRADTRSPRPNVGKAYCIVNVSSINANA